MSDTKEHQTKRKPKASELVELSYEELISVICMKMAKDRSPLFTCQGPCLLSIDDKAIETEMGCIILLGKHASAVVKQFEAQAERAFEEVPESKLECDSKATAIAVDGETGEFREATLSHEFAPKGGTKKKVVH